MLKEERLQRLLQILDEQGSVTAEQLSQKLFVSLPTVYRDLRELQRRQLAVRGDGRIRRSRERSVTTPLDFRRTIHAAEKAAIARAAVKLIRDGSVIFLDASTTVSYLIDDLAGFQDLTVLTNGLATAALLRQAGVRTCCVGGALVENSLAVGGRMARDTAARFPIDTILFSAYAVSEKGMIIDPSEEETALRRYILQRAAVSVLLCDKSKFGKTSLFNVAPLSDIDYLVTDACLTFKEAPVKRKIITV
ncbi:DeoR/GlpR family DNA-binding transcription regulator [Dysosmobacter sp.]|uniref:DeoR/GlpR family DNA-binding transcription regulator n=1 Tax=Dysosmobacter sp. TaxID=2591382 RepID=UPI002A8B2640|nr:DeoR/GlpR family DNA-binding transcription regulator [Dysosmobacter sp.]MDY3282102.1 DeoR/GlpR family DNA-binding transcription regulator [Dysosmobacter sp.]